ncbi:maleylpyruvate isomerase N-terminal domain-containing protein [Mycobacterium sp. BMJ-28]
MQLFGESWDRLRTAVSALDHQDFAKPSGCAGWLIRDLLCHLIIDAQDVLITLATPTRASPTRDAVTYWTVSPAPPDGQDPLDALTVRLAAAYQDPGLLLFHLDDVGAAAGRAAELADPAGRVCTRGEVLIVEDFLSAYVFEWTLHHLDLTAHLGSASGPSVAALRHSRGLFEKLTGTVLPATLADQAALLIGTGRRAPTPVELAELGALATRLPHSVG